MPRSRANLFERLIGFRYLFVFNLALIIFLSVILGREFVRGQEIERQISALQAEAQALAVRNVEISELRTAFQSESFIEREARLKLGLKKPGEELAVVQAKSAALVFGESTGENNPLTVLAPEALAPVANPTKWWYYFFDRAAFAQYAKASNSN